MGSLPIVEDQILRQLTIELFWITNECFVEVDELLL
jgi:hypothetical protein